MFDTVAGLPVHVLVVHAVVVGVPVAALATIAVAARPGWRGRPGWAVAVVNAGLLALTLAARESGWALARRVGEVRVVEHSSLGERMPWFVGGLLAVSVLVPVLRHRRPLATAVLILSVVAAALNLWWIVRVGDSGARATWGPIVEGTSP